MTDRKQQRPPWLIPALCCLLAAAMAGLSHISPSLYNRFSQTIGDRGAINVAAGPEDTLEISDREVVVRFDASVGEGVDLLFRPKQVSMPIHVGERTLAHYVTENPGADSFFGMATFSVTPHRVASYISKIECFCFSEHKLEPGEAVEMPISFYIDPALEEDAEMDDIRTITFSYTFIETAPWSNHTENES